MSDREFVFRLGPFGADAEHRYVYYVYPGKPDAFAFPALDDAAAWLRICDEFDPARLACEKALGTPDKPAAVEIQDFDRHRLHALVSMAYANLTADPFAGVQTEELISEFAIACKTYLDSPYAAGHMTDRNFKLVFAGEPDISTIAFVSSEQNTRTLLQFEFADLRDDVDDRPLGFGVEFQKGPEFIRDAMHRGLGINVAPIPWVGTDGRRGVPNDTILSLLVPALNALAHLGEEGGEARGQFQLGSLNVTCQVIRQAHSG